MVTATGTRMELGRIAELAEQAEEGPTPLQEALSQLARWMIWVAAGFSVGIPLIGWLTGQPLVEMVVTGFALFFASVPEELPVIITLILAFGGYWLSRQGAVMRRHRAVEMLGAVSVIATDKTGTLTENRMRATKFWPATQTTRLLTVGVVCNDVAVDGLAAAGDPLDRALVEAAQARGVDVDALRAAHSLVDEYSFDSARQRMSVTVRRGRRLWVTVKGAPESVLEVCTTVLVGDAAKPLTNKRRAAVLRTLTGSGGLRVVALAEKESNAPSLSQAEAEAKLTFLGLVGMQDPLRRDVPEAIASCRAAGIRTVIVSGDHPETVGAIAGELGFPTSDGVLTGQDLETLGATAFRETVDQHSVFARTTPEQKLRIVRALTEAGSPRGGDRRRHQRCASPGRSGGRHRHGTDGHRRGPAGRRHGAHGRQLRDTGALNSAMSWAVRQPGEGHPLLPGLQDRPGGLCTAGRSARHPTPVPADADHPH